MCGDAVKSRGPRAHTRQMHRASISHPPGMGVGAGEWVRQEQRAGCLVWRRVAAQWAVAHPRDPPSSTAASIDCRGAQLGMRRCEDTVFPQWA
eukprot:985882-Pyramimonas_sp.AAC.1